MWMPLQIIADARAKMSEPELQASKEDGEDLGSETEFAKAAKSAERRQAMAEAPLERLMVQR